MCTCVFVYVYNKSAPSSAPTAFTSLIVSLMLLYIYGVLYGCCVLVLWSTRVLLEDIIC